MSFVAALMWATGAHILFLMAAMTVVAVDEASSWDPVTWVICQAAAYLLTLFFMLRVHAPQGRIRDFVGFRATHPLMVPLALVVGVSSAFPADWVFGKLQALEPAEDGFFDLLDVFFRMSMPERVMVAIAFAGVGPLVEELIFRGGLFSTTRRRYPPAQVIAVTSLLFAMIHLDPVKFLPLAAMGGLLGYVRWASGSIVPSLAVHVAFNAVPFYELLQATSRPAETPTPGAWAAAGLAVTVVGLGLVHLTGRSKMARAARREDR